MILEYAISKNQEIQSIALNEKRDLKAVFVRQKQGFIRANRENGFYILN